MSYTDPAFMPYHAIAQAVLVGGLAAITTQNTWAGTEDITKRRVCDYRTVAVANFSGVASNHHIQFDRGAASVSELDRIIIPAGHNYTGKKLKVLSDDNDGMSSAAIILAQTDIGSAALIDLPLVGGVPSEQQYIRVNWPASGTWNPDTTEVWIGEKKITTTGVAQAWRNPLETPLVEQPFPTRDAAVLLGPARRTWELEHYRLDATDVAVYDEIAATGRTIPFWFWPPDDAYTEPLLMKLTDDMEREQDSPVPKTEITYTVRLQMREQTT
jgi:hypothetical protein